MTHKVIVIWALIVLFLPFGWVHGQLKSQLRESASVEQNIKIPGVGSSLLGLGFLDKSRFSMHQSYSLSLSTFGKQSASMGVYQNNFSYLFSDKLMMNGRVGFYHDPLKIGNTQLNQNLLENISYGADLIYRPKENVVLNFSFDRAPATYYYGYGPYSYRYFPY
ncbi:MAG: hypothetical protein PHW79_06045 [Candidatus Marinimicrobia bacterium]|nr:hypothetical protein [Candidatus Neomarinimicrobiota bacterium]